MFRNYKTNATIDLQELKLTKASSLNSKIINSEITKITM